MESIVISQKKLRAIVFKSFFASRGYDAVLNPSDGGFTLRKFHSKTGDTEFSHQFNTHYPEKEHYYYDHGDQFHSMNWDDLLRLFMSELDKFEDSLPKSENPIIMLSKAKAIEFAMRAAVSLSGDKVDDQAWDEYFTAFMKEQGK